MNKADAIPSMRAAETNALRAVERAISGPLAVAGPGGAVDSHIDAGVCTGGRGASRSADAWAANHALNLERNYQQDSPQESYQQDQYGKYQLKPQVDQIDPVIAGLLTHLPLPGSVWPIEARKQWLELMEGSFRLIFKDKPVEPAS